MCIGQWYLSPLQSRHIGTSQFSQSPLAAPSYFPEFHKKSEISSLSRVILVLGKARSHREPNMGNRGVEPLRWYDVSPKKPCTRHDAWVGTLSWWSCQSPAAHSCGLLNHLNSFYREMFKLNANLIQIHCSTQSFLMQQPHSTHAHSTVSTTPAD